MQYMYMLLIFFHLNYSIKKRQCDSEVAYYLSHSSAGSKRETTHKFSRFGGFWREGCFILLLFWSSEVLQEVSCWLSNAIFSSRVRHFGYFGHCLDNFFLNSPIWLNHMLTAQVLTHGFSQACAFKLAVGNSQCPICTFLIHFIQTC